MRHRVAPESLCLCQAQSGCWCLSAMGKTARESAPVRERGCLVWTRLNWQTAFVKLLTFYLAIGICYQWTPVDVVCSRAPCRMHPRSWLQKSRVMPGFPLSGPLHHLVIRKPATALSALCCPRAVSARVILRRLHPSCIRPAAAHREETMCNSSWAPAWELTCSCMRHGFFQST